MTNTELQVYQDTIEVNLIYAIRDSLKELGLLKTSQVIFQQIKPTKLLRESAKLDDKQLVSTWELIGE